MTAREAYFKAYVHSTKQMGMLFYLSNSNNTPCVGNTPWMIFDKNHHEDNIQIMEMIEKNKEGFMFWNISNDGNEFLKNQSKKMREVLSGLAFMQK